jgi:3-methyladenine DNA glycosylase AlkC
MKLKDMFNQESVAALANAIQHHYAAFNREAFIASVFGDAWEVRELKERMRHITISLHDVLPEEYRTALDILRRALPALHSHGFVQMIFPDYVEVFGLEDWEASIPALEAFTQVVSAEYAIRPFIVHFQDRTMAQMLEWARHKSPEVRRLASEGCRPRLPWGIALPALKADPSPILPVIELLKHDESESVRRSVANNLNDISKDRPEVVIEVLRRWQTDNTEEIRWITRHALRTLLKAGHPDALALLGYHQEPAIVVHNLSVEPDTIHMGDAVTFSFDIESLGDQPQNLMIDYVVHHVRANGKQTPKVFKLTKKTIQPGQILHIKRTHSFAPVTTRRYYPGEHAIEPKINGQRFGSTAFLLRQRG